MKTPSDLYDYYVEPSTSYDEIAAMDVALIAKLISEIDPDVTNPDEVAEIIRTYAISCLEDIRSAASILGRMGGRKTSSRKAMSSRINGKRGGRPRKSN